MIDFNQWQYFHFLRPEFLWLFVALVIIIKLFAQRDDTLAVWRNVMSEDILASLTVPGNSKHFISPHNLALALIFPVTLVLMGPTWKQQPSPFSENNAALIIALDVSDSMEQTDIQPSRLIRAKQKILALLELRGDTNTALIAYAGSAHTVMPITDDSEMIRHFLDVLEPDLMPTAGKLPETVLPLAAELLAPTGVPGTVLLLTDGASGNTSTQAFSTFFKQQPHQLIVWTVGKAIDDNTLDKSSAITPMQLPLLTALAKESQGRLIEMSTDKQDLITINNYIAHNLVVVDDKSRPWLDAGYPLVFVAGAIFLFWFRRGWTLQW